ncbi:MAG: hypothetical protein HY606_06605 [Planctomycetes bacterium]|nr:hypothetical protein [Planctomycetota bacterium]
MAVDPAFSGQEFKREILSKIKELRNAFTGGIGVDGGIDKVTVKEVKSTGANVVAAGTVIFGSADIRKAMDKLKCKEERAC